MVKVNSKVPHLMAWLSHIEFVLTKNSHESIVVSMTESSAPRPGFRFRKIIKYFDTRNIFLTYY